ncbi:uncharacterized protein LOC142229463 [Haematobia irritans]|uniref:uncharacterized protein LOC142229463 n=1 Tax=Haematobia irritans TaxID=7368 RepID=UPI003F4FCAC3
MKFITSLALIQALIVACQGYSFFIPARLPGVCMYNGIMLKRGDNNMMNSCQNMRCNEDGSILVQGCGHYDMRDCRVLDPMNLSKPYPDCCRMNFLCTMANGEVVNREVHPLETGIYA